MKLDLRYSAEIILNENSSYNDIKNSIDNIAQAFYQITKLPSNLEKSDHGSNLPDGEALSPQTAAGCIFDYFRTTKFLRGVKKAIDIQLKDEKEKIKVMYVGSGPFATLLLPLLPLFAETQLDVYIIDYHKSSIDALNKIISNFGLEKYFEELFIIDALNYENERKVFFDIIIIETMQKALVDEPQVAITNHFSQFLAKDGILIPEAIKISAELADLRSEFAFSKSKWTNFWLKIRKNNAKDKRIFLKDIFILDKNFSEKYNIENNRIGLSNVKIEENTGRMNNLILLTDIKIYDDIILSQEDETGLTKLYFDRELPAIYEGMEIDFSYQLGSKPRFLINTAKN